jgi:hypothetical protein
MKKSDIETGLTAGLVFQRMGNNYLLHHIDCTVLLPDKLFFLVFYVMGR